MSFKADDIDRLFDKLQFRTRESGDKLAFFYYGGKLLLFTRRPHSKRNVDSVAHLIRQQCKLGDKQFRDAVECPFGYDDYVELLKSKGIIKPKS